MSEWPHNAYKETRLVFECDEVESIMQRVTDGGFRPVDGHWYCPCDDECRVKSMKSIDHSCPEGSLFVWKEEQC